MSLALSLLGSCGDDDSSDDSGINVEGAWFGEWEREGAAGDLLFTIEQTNDVIRGTAIINGSPCLSDFQIWGILDVNTGETNLLGLDLNISNNDLEDLYPTDSVEELRESGIEHILRFDGVFTETSFNMDYTIVEWGACTNATGVFDIDLQ